MRKWSLSDSASTNLICSFCYGNGTADICGASTINHSVVHYKIADGTESIVQRTFCFIHDLRNDEGVACRT